MDFYTCDCNDPCNKSLKLLKIDSFCSSEVLYCISAIQLLRTLFCVSGLVYYISVISLVQCISMIDYDPSKMSDSEQPHLELKIAEGNLLRCYKQPVEVTGYTMAEVKERENLILPLKKYFLSPLCLFVQLGESNKRGLVPTDFITEVYGPSSTNPQVHTRYKERSIVHSQLYWWDSGYT